MARIISDRLLKRGVDPLPNGPTVFSQQEALKTQVIDPQDDLHEAVERSVAGLSPEERAEKLMEMFGGAAEAEPAPEADPMQPGIDALEEWMKQKRAEINARKAGAKNQSKPTR